MSRHATQLVATAAIAVIVLGSALVSAAAPSLGASATACSALQTGGVVLWSGRVHVDGCVVTGSAVTVLCDPTRWLHLSLANVQWRGGSLVFVSGAGSGGDVANVRVDVTDSLFADTTADTLVVRGAGAARNVTLTALRSTLDSAASAGSLLALSGTFHTVADVSISVADSAVRNHVATLARRAAVAGLLLQQGAVRVSDVRLTATRARLNASATGGEHVLLGLLLFAADSQSPVLERFTAEAHDSAVAANSGCAVALCGLCTGLDYSTDLLGVRLEALRSNVTVVNGDDVAAVGIVGHFSARAHDVAIVVANSNVTLNSTKGSGAAVAGVQTAFPNKEWRQLLIEVTDSTLELYGTGWAAAAGFAAIDAWPETAPITDASITVLGSRVTLAAQYGEVVAVGLYVDGRLLARNVTIGALHSDVSATFNYFGASVGIMSLNSRSDARELHVSARYSTVRAVAETHAAAAVAWLSLAAANVTDSTFGALFATVHAESRTPQLLAGTVALGFTTVRMTCATQPLSNVTRTAALAVDSRVFSTEIALGLASRCRENGSPVDNLTRPLRTDEWRVVALRSAVTATLDAPYGSCFAQLGNYSSAAAPSLVRDVTLRCPGALPLTIAAAPDSIYASHVTDAATGVDVTAQALAGANTACGVGPAPVLACTGPAPPATPVPSTTAQPPVYTPAPQPPATPTQTPAPSATTPAPQSPGAPQDSPREAPLLSTAAAVGLAVGAVAGLVCGATVAFVILRRPRREVIDTTPIQVIAPVKIISTDPTDI